MNRDLEDRIYQHNMFCEDLREVLAEIEGMLVDKNRKYGNSALNPCRIFSKADTAEQLRIRIDDKLSRMISRQTDEDEDVELDLIGYLLMLRVYKLRERRKANAKIRLAAVTKLKEAPANDSE